MKWKTGIGKDRKGYIGRSFVLQSNELMASLLFQWNYIEDTVFSPGLFTNTTERTKRTWEKMNIKHMETDLKTMIWWIDYYWCYSFWNSLIIYQLQAKMLQRICWQVLLFFLISDLTGRSRVCWINLLFRLISQINLMARPQVLSSQDLLFEIPAVLFRFYMLQQTHGVFVPRRTRLTSLLASLLTRVFLEGRHKRGNNSERTLCSGMQDMFSGDGSISGPYLQEKNIF